MSNTYFLQRELYIWCERNLSILYGRTGVTRGAKEVRGESVCRRLLYGVDLSATRALPCWKTINGKQLFKILVHAARVTFEQEYYIFHYVPYKN